MRFELVLPYQIKEAITKHTPVVLPIGVMVRLSLKLSRE